MKKMHFICLMQDIYYFRLFEILLEHFVRETMYLLIT